MSQRHTKEHKNISPSLNHTHHGQCHWIKIMCRPFRAKILLLNPYPRAIALGYTLSALRALPQREKPSALIQWHCPSRERKLPCPLSERVWLRGISAGSIVLDWTKMFRFRLQAWTSIKDTVKIVKKQSKKLNCTWRETPNQYCICLELML